MKILSILAALFTAFQAFAAADTLPVRGASGFYSQYVLVGVSGYKTIRDKKEAKNIFSSRVDQSGQVSGAWENLNKGSANKIKERAFLTHYSSGAEIDAVLKLVEDRGQCSQETGLIILANSWGTGTAQTLAKRYYEKCKTLVSLFVLIEGIAKPTFFSYTQPIWSFNCVNFYQNESTLHGAPIRNCVNNFLNYAGGESSFYEYHISAEWDGSTRGNRLIQEFLDEKMSPTFALDAGIDSLKILAEKPKEQIPEKGRH
jgi:hypothetical protein